MNCSPDWSRAERDPASRLRRRRTEERRCGASANGWRSTKPRRPPPLDKVNRPGGQVYLCFCSFGSDMIVSVFLPVGHSM